MIIKQVIVIVIEAKARDIILQFRDRTILHKQVLMFSQYSVMSCYL